MLSDLRDSGSIEQDADSVIFLYRDEYYKTGSENQGTSIVEVIVAKNRHGSTKTVNMGWNAPYTKFVTIDDTQEGSPT
jgi:replicative DNA helicase